MKPLKIVFVLLFVSISLNALTFKEIKTNDKFKTIKIQGKFDRSSLKQFNEILTKYKNEKIKFIPYSKGGYANDVFGIFTL